MKMFCPPTDKTCERCQKGAEWGLLAVLAPLVSGGAGIFEISTHSHFRQLCGRRLQLVSRDESPIEAQLARFLCRKISRKALFWAGFCHCLVVFLFEMRLPTTGTRHPPRCGTVALPIPLMV
jgi:hypothetical protein